ncbi:hypothetical protein BDR26DRAFT_890195 [Obelidium mucronatum]|nr:hypothetical protein BDR26DRAFT_890195 [Obelidium mucronatum]
MHKLAIGVISSLLIRPKITIGGTTFESPAELLDGLIIDTPIFKFNNNNTTNTTSTTINPSTSLNTPTILADGRISYEVELPGFTKEDLTLSFEETSKTITIKGNKPGDALQGRKDRSVDFSVGVPENVDAGGIHASMAEGVLVLVVQQKNVEGRRIVIE